MKMLAVPSASLARGVRIRGVEIRRAASRSFLCNFSTAVQYSSSSHPGHDDGGGGGAAADDDFDVVLDRRTSPVGSAKWRKYGEDVIPMWVADMDFKSPPSVRQAIADFAQDGVYGYSRPPKELVDAIVRYLRDKHRVIAQPNHIVLLPSMMEGIQCALAATGKEGDNVMVASPVYYPFFSAPTAARMRTNIVPMRRADDDDAATPMWSFDWDAMDRAVNERTKYFLLCSPQNPTGRCFERKEIEDLVSFCDKHALTLLSDEIHCDLILKAGAQHHSVASFFNDENAALSSAALNRTMTFMAPSKTYNVAGVPAAFAIIPNPAHRRLVKEAAAAKLPPITCFGYVCSMACYGAGGYEDPEAWRMKLVEYLRGNANIVSERLSSKVFCSAGIHLSASFEATYLAWLDASSLRQRTGVEPHEFFENAGVGLSDGAPFGADAHLRINFACPRSVLIEGLNRMERAVAVAGKRD